MPTAFLTHRERRSASSTIERAASFREYARTRDTSHLYVGQDRRHPVAHDQHPVLGRRLLLISAAALLGWLVLLELAAGAAHPLAQQLLFTARGVASGLFLTAGAMRLARWRLTGEASVGWNAAALLVFGVSLPVMALVGPFLQPGPVSKALPVAKVLLLIPVLVLLAVGLRSAPVHARLHPLRLATAVLLASAVFIAVLACLPVANSSLMSSRVLWESAEGVAAASWAALAIGTWARQHRQRLATGRWAAYAMGLMAVSDGLRALDINLSGSLAPAAAGFQLVAAGVVVTAAATQLWEVFSAEGNRTLQLAGGLHDTEYRLSCAEAAERDRLHDARSVVVGVLGASQLLSQRAPTVLDPDRLHRLMSAELDRLAQVLDPDRIEPIQDFELIGAIDRVVATQRLAGSTVVVDCPDAWVSGRPITTATVIANLLTNSRIHAPGATISIATAMSEGCVVILVDDDGPGIPVAEWGPVLQRGHRGSASTSLAGSGLGLYTASASMAGQGGSLRLSAAPSGGLRVVLTMPAAHQQIPAKADQAQAC